MLNFENTYARLPDRFFARLDPTPVAKPGLIRINRVLAAEMGIDAAELESPQGLAWLAGNAVPDGAEPLAMAYAGHQFGGWSPQLGDGRAILLGEVVGPAGARRDIQLKGSGPTPFSRMGDGRAWLGPVLREYVVSEAMHALGVPTTRALAAVTTGEPVQRETVLPGAVLARVASSHIRVGTFQYFLARQDQEALELLTDHVIARHYPAAASAQHPALALTEAVVAAQAELIAQWMSIGFIHGVMNTDNMSVAGETIDYGPCAFMDVFHPMQVFSSIDAQGRYAYRNQPLLAQWNLAQLATSLLPLMDASFGGRDEAVAAAQAAVDGFMPQYEAARLARFSAKLGLSRAEEDDGELISDLLEHMAEGEMDFTLTFRALSETPETAPDGLADWHRDWVARLAREGAEPGDRRETMCQVNPAIIARNHQVEAVIKAAVAGDLAPFHALTEALQNPFDAPADSPYRAAPLAGEKVLQTFCGT